MPRREPLRGKKLQKGIIDTARRLGWRVAHFPTIQDFRGTWRTPVAADGKGFPDLLLVRDRVIVREVKGDGDKLNPAQTLWLTAFRLAGADAGVWAPKHWLDGGIEDELRQRLPRPDLRDGIALDLIGCARCDGNGHDGLLFLPLIRPIPHPDGDLTHWAPCPITGEPIVMRALGGSTT